MTDLDITKPLLFEVAWEVANKVGGIYTVIKTKVPVTVQEYGSRYVLIGPLNAKSASIEVEDCEPLTPCLKETLANLKSHGIHYKFGKWLVDGNPMVLLLDLGSAWYKLNEWKGDLWNIAGVPSPEDDTETNNTIVFGYLVAWFLGQFLHNQKTLESRPADELDQELSKPALIAQFHEWQAGVALVLIRKRQLKVASIFTTHATLLGRYLCAGDVDFYNNLKFFDVDMEAGKRGIYHRYCIERAAAHCCDVFTTVSHITAYEAEWLLKRKPDGVLPNGLSIVKLNALHEFQNLHAQSKEKIHEFVRGHFCGHYSFDLDNTLYFFTAGRFEFRNKGVDMFIESLARLNHRLKAMGSKMTVVAFIIMPAPNNSYTVEALRGHASMKQLRDTVNEVQREVGKRIFEAAVQSRLPEPKELLSDHDIVALKRRIYANRRHNLPPIVTHNMIDDATNPILVNLRRVQLFNYESDRVKVVYHPEFLSPNNPLFNMEYEEFLRGCHLGVFPSYYEPWGYTPAECTIMGIPSITTNLSGFGCFMSEMISFPSDYGIYIVDRRMKNVEESLNQLTDMMVDFCTKTRRQRINQRNRTERLSDVLDWNRMGLEYVKARWVSIRRRFPDLVVEESEESTNDFGAGYESDYSANREDLSGLKYHQKVPRPPSVPGSPRLREDDTLHLFDDEHHHPLIADIKQLGINGLQGTYEPPTTSKPYKETAVQDQETPTVVSKQ
ncbi:glycogen synthase [Gorgonomyces haynaldii]|nr:glycogen synthase [Gorgonomyces haynaldii]